MEREPHSRGMAPPSAEREPAAQREAAPRPAAGAGHPIAHSPRVAAQRQQIQRLFGPAAQLRPAETEIAEPAPVADTVQRAENPAPRPNRTGLPDPLKSGVESLSGLSLDHVKVHYNSAQPAQLNALAYAQGSDIHVAPGQEKHLPHEAWHVVQQMQGRVQPTMQMKAGVPVNDDAGLEKEADVMGQRSLELAPGAAVALKRAPGRAVGEHVVQGAFEPGDKPEERAVWVLARSTSTGQEAIAMGQGPLAVGESSDWKTLTRDKLGLGIPDADREILAAWAGDETKELANRRQYEVLIAHELTHLRHFLSAPGTYAVRGQRGDWGNGWDADPEEQLTVMGETRISKAVWEAKYAEAYRDSGIEALLKQKEEFDRTIADEIEKNTPARIINQFKRNRDRVVEAIAKIKLDPVPQGAVAEGDDYVFRDGFSENRARLEKNFKVRESYAAAGFVEQDA